MGAPNQEESPMKQSTKASWLGSTGDLVTETIEDVPVKGESVIVRGLPAAYSNQASSEALVMKQVGRDQIATVDTAKMEVLQFLHGVVEPKFDSVEEVEQVAEKFGPAWRRVIDRIDALSGVRKEDYERAAAKFPGGSPSTTGEPMEDGAASGNGDS